MRFHRFSPVMAADAAAGGGGFPLQGYIFPGTILGSGLNVGLGGAVVCLVSHCFITGLTGVVLCL